MKLTLRSLGLLLICCGLFSACSQAEPTPSPASVIVLAPDPSADVTTASLDTAREVLQRRLDGMLGQSGVTVEGSHLRVELTSQDDAPTAIQLATGIGALAFFDSADALAPGASMPEDAEIILTDGDISQAEIEHAEFGDFWVLVNLTSKGAQKMAEYSAANIGRCLVIALEGTVISSPRIQSPIPDGQVSIVGDFDQKSARSLAAQLNSGRLPFKLVVVATD